MKDENAMQLDGHVTDLLTKPSLACPLAIQRLVISNRIMRPQLAPHYGRLLRVLPTSKSCISQLFHPTISQPTSVNVPSSNELNTTSQLLVFGPASYHLSDYYHTWARYFNTIGHYSPHTHHWERWRASLVDVGHPMYPSTLRT